MDKNWAKKKKLSTNKHTVQPQDQADNIYQPLNPKVAEQKIQDLMILRAWRHQKEKNKEMEADNKGLSNQVESLQLQIYALRQLLDAEKTRVINVNNDLRKILGALDECKKEKQSLIKEKDQLEVRLHLMEDRMFDMENECKNQKNELITAKSEAQNWEKQLEKEREKLSKMKDERKFFIEEVRFKGNLLVWQIRSFEQFSRLLNILQCKPNSSALPWDDALARIDLHPEISKRLEKNPKDQQTLVIVGKPLENLELRALLPKAERKTAEEDERNEELEKSILGKTEEHSAVILRLSLLAKFL